MKNRMIRNILIPTLIIYSMGVFAATYHSFNRPADHKHIVTVNGKIEKDEYSKFQQFIDSQTLPIDIILLQSNGGYISPALEIGEYIHEHSYILVLRPTAILRACIPFFPASIRFFIRKER